jgi:type III pantothenate kinase
MIVAIDAGNSRLKWGLHDGAGWLARGILATADVAWLSEAAEEWPVDARVVVCNVAGARIGNEIQALLGKRHRDIHYFIATADCCGVTNGYENPRQLGADRWAALLGARGLTEAACLVVCAGTATTADLLTAEGYFQGGIILPGFDLMRAALADNTAQLPLAEGSFHDKPRRTMDAIVSGCLQAQLGAVERMYANIAVATSDSVCLLTGGAAARLLPHLSIPARLEENLILDGLVRYGAAI